MSLTYLDTAMGRHRQPGSTGARPMRDKLSDAVSVRDFLCDDGQFVQGNGTHDDTTGIQRAMDWGVANGAEMWFPPGTYRVTAQITIDESGTTTEDATRLNVVGSGPGCTVIKTEVASGPTLYFRGSESWAGGGIHAYQRLADLRIQGGGYNSIAVSGENLPYFAVENVVILNCGDGFSFSDILSSYFQNITVRGCLRGFTAQRHITASADYESDPNNLNFIGCTFSSLPHYGLYLNGGSCINFLGGSIENIGLSYHWPSGAGTRPSTRWGLKMDKAGREGAVGFSLVGTYLEGNDVTADVWIDQPNNPADTGSPGLDDTDDPTAIRLTDGAAYCFSGVSFQRIFNSDPVTIDGVEYPRSPSVANIRLDTGTKPAALSITGCGFRGAGTYTPSSARPCIQLPASSRGWSASQHGNFFSHSTTLDAPAWSKTPTFTAGLATDQGIANDAETLVSFNVVENYGNCFDNSGHAFIMPHDGRMHFDVSLGWVGFTSSATDGDDLEIRVKVNGNLTRTQALHAKLPQNLTLNFDLNLLKNDQVQVYAYVNTGGASRTIYANLTKTSFTGRPA